MTKERVFRQRGHSRQQGAFDWITPDGTDESQDSELPECRATADSIQSGDKQAAKATRTSFLWATAREVLSLYCSSSHSPKKDSDGLRNADNIQRWMPRCAIENLRLGVRGKLVYAAIKERITHLRWLRATGGYSHPNWQRRGKEAKSKRLRKKKGTVRRWRYRLPQGSLFPFRGFCFRFYLTAARHPQLTAAAVPQRIAESRPAF